MVQSPPVPILLFILSALTRQDFYWTTEKASGLVGVWPNDNSLPVMDECTFDSSATEEESIRHVGRPTQITV